MKKKILILLFCVILAVCTVALCGCFGLFGGGENGVGGGGNSGGKKVALTKDNLSTYPSDANFEYTGKPLEFGSCFFIYPPEGTSSIDADYFDYECADSVSLGKHTVKITATDDNPYYYGSITVEFTIVGAIRTVYNVEDLIAAIESNRYREIYLDFKSLSLSTIDFGDKDLTIPAGTEVVIRNTLVYEGTMVVNGKLTVNGVLNFDRYNNSDGSIILENDGEIVVNGKIVSDGDFRLYNSGTVTVNGEINFTAIDAWNYQLVYTNDVEIANVTCDSSNFRQHVRHNLTADDVALEFYSVEYSTVAANLKPSVKFWVDGDEYEISYKSYTSIYRDCTNAGVAYVDVTMGKHAAYFYGSATVPYEITKTRISVSSVADYNAKKATGNYDTFTTDSNFAVSSGATLTVEIGDTFLPQSLTINGTLVNHGTVTTGSVYLYGSLENHGTFTATPTDDYVEIQTNAASGIKNSGTMTLNGEIVCVKLTDFVNSGTFTNTDTVWSYVNLPSDFSNVIVKRQIAADDVVLFHLSETYTGKALSASLADECALQYGQYRVEYAYAGQSYSSAQPINAGKLTLKITVTDERTPFYANNTDGYVNYVEGIEFEILRGQKSISSVEDLRTYVANLNYWRLYLSKDVNTENAFITLPEDMVLDTNGYRLTVERSLTVYGTLTNSKLGEYSVDYAPTMDDCGVYLAKGVIENYGTIVNNNLICVASGAINVHEGSAIENHGLMFVNDLIDEGVCTITNDGTIYTRENLFNLHQNRSRIDLNQWEWDYTAANITPTATLYNANGEVVELTDRFTVTIYNDVKNRICTVTITVNNLFDKEYCSDGAWELAVTINKSVIRIATMDELVTALADNNYLGYVITKGFALDRNLTVPFGAYLDLGIYGFSSYEKGCTVTMLNSLLYVTADSMSRLAAYMCADVIYLSSNEAVEVTASINSSGTVVGSGTTNTFIKNYANKTIDLQGNQVLGKLTINIPDGFTLNIINSKKSSSASLTYYTVDGNGQPKDYYRALTINGSTGTAKVNISDVNIAGLYVERGINLTATNCKFRALSETTLTDDCIAYYATRDGRESGSVTATFDNCIFEGYVCAYVAGGTHTFKNCTMNATGPYGNSNYNDRGSAIILAAVSTGSAMSYPAYVNIDGGTITSAKGYCLQFTYSDYVNNQKCVKVTSATDINTAWSSGQSAKCNYNWYTVVDSL